MSFVQRQPRAMGLGDIFSDLSSLASLTASSMTPGGVSAWIQNQLAQLRRLPSDVANLQGQIVRIRAVVASSGGQPDTIASLDAAQNDVSTIQAQLPLVQAQVGQVAASLAPLLSGSGGDASLSVILSSGDILTAFDGLNTLVSLRDHATQIVQNVVTNAGLPTDLRSKIAQAITGGDVSTLLKYGALGLVGWWIIKKVL